MTFGHTRIVCRDLLSFLPILQALDDSFILTQLIDEDVIGELQQLEPVVQRRIAGGTSGQEDLLRLQVEIGRIENDLASLEKVFKVAVPGLVIILLLLVVHAARVGDLAKAWHFLFDFDFSKISLDMTLMALGQAMFSARR